MKDHRFASVCPTCQEAADGALGVNSADPPDEGSAFLCWSCRQPAVVTADGGLRLPTDAEREAILAHPQVHKALAFMERVFGPAFARRAEGSP